MEWSEWQPIYLGIARKLNLNIDSDRKATALITTLLMKTDPSSLLTRLESTIKSRVVVVCGAGPSLERNLNEAIRSPNLTDAIYVAADGAASAFLELDRTCDVLVTDLDGDNDDLKRMINRGALPIVHAHGDNIDRVEQFVPTIKETLGSTQVEPTNRAFLWGGFTDGDRACYIVLSYAPRRLVLAGMDFGTVVGRWSKPNRDSHYQADRRKRTKLEIARQLITSLLVRTNVPYNYMT